MKKLIQKFANLSLFALLLLGNFSFASAQSADQICQYTNYQNGTVAPESFAGLPTEEPARTDEINKRNTEYFNRQQQARDASAVENFKDYVVVIAEEPLGPGDGKFSANCARKIECSMGNYNPAAPEQQVQSCYSQYTTVSGCTPSDTVTCEIVQVYVAPVGTGLLYSYVGQVYRYISFIGGLIAVFVIIIAGIMWTSAGGNSEAVSKAKAMITRSLVGLVVLFLSALILYTINPNFFTLG